MSQENEIRRIRADPTLTTEEQTRVIQDILYKEGDTEIDSDDSSTYQSSCHHRPHNIFFRAPCCLRLFRCPSCHDEASDHTVDVTQIREFYCYCCGKKQKRKSQYCDFCNVALGYYICSCCFIWDLQLHGQFHCRKCRRCHRGSPLSYRHCSECKVCLPSARCREHRFHVSDTLSTTCAVCLSGSLRNGSPDIRVMNCGHTLHESCYQDLIIHSSRCPTCFASIRDMTTIFQLYAEEAAYNVTPPEMRREVLIYCYDCRTTKNTEYNLAHLQCQECFSFNVRLA